MVAAAARSPGSPLAAARRGLARPRCHVGSRGCRGRAGVGSLGAGAIGIGPGAERLRRGFTAARHPLSRPPPSPPPLFSSLLARPRGRLRDAAAVRPRRRRRRKGRKGPRAPSVAGRRGQRRAGPGHERHPAAAAPAAGHQRGLAAAYPAGEREPLRLPRQEMRGKSRPGGDGTGAPPGAPPRRGGSGPGAGRGV